MSYPEESLDIEELATLANRIKNCSYYHNRSAQENADIVLMPYNYILSKVYQKNMNIELEDAILIIDEAHNIAQAAEDALSFEINTEHLKRIIYELSYLLKQVEPELYDEYKGTL